MKGGVWPPWAKNLLPRSDLFDYNGLVENIRTPDERFP